MRKPTDMTGQTRTGGALHLFEQSPVRRRSRASDGWLEKQDVHLPQASIVFSIGPPSRDVQVPVNGELGR